MKRTQEWFEIYVTYSVRMIRKFLLGLTRCVSTQEDHAEEEIAVVAEDAAVAAGEVILAAEMFATHAMVVEAAEEAAAVDTVVAEEATEVGADMEVVVTAVEVMAVAAAAEGISVEHGSLAKSIGGTPNSRIIQFRYA